MFDAISAPRSSKVQKELIYDIISLPSLSSRLISIPLHSGFFQNNRAVKRSCATSGYSGYKTSGE